MEYINLLKDEYNVEGVRGNFFVEIIIINSIICFAVTIHVCDLVHNSETIFEPRYEKIGYLHMRKQRRRSASRKPRS